jgi:hypothetical protein
MNFLLGVFAICLVTGAFDTFTSTDTLRMGAYFVMLSMLLDKLDGFAARLVNASEYGLNSFESLRGFLCGLYAGNYDISHVFVDNLCKIAHSDDLHEAEKLLRWLDRFSEENAVKFTVTISGDADSLTEGMKSFL